MELTASRVGQVCLSDPDINGKGPDIYQRKVWKGRSNHALLLVNYTNMLLGSSPYPLLLNCSS